VAEPEVVRAVVPVVVRAVVPVVVQVAEPEVVRAVVPVVVRAEGFVKTLTLKLMLLAPAYVRKDMP
jgi:tetrahydromethanopterin S-methyltransferase subunit C